MFSKWNRVLVATAVVALVSACGGGGGGDGDSSGGTTDGGSVTPAPTAAAADKYVGTWTMSCASFGAESESETLTISKASDTVLNVEFVLRTYAGSGCTGTPAIENVKGTVSIDSQTTLSYGGQSRTFDQLTLSAGGYPGYKWTGAVVNNALVIDFEDNDNESTTAYPTNPNEGESVYSK